MRGCFALLLLAATLPADAAVISARPDKVTLVVYSAGGRLSAEALSGMTMQTRRNQGLALVSETRTVDLPAGVSDIQFRNVMATLVPPSVQVSGLDGISERNFDFNLLTPGALLAKSIGQTVRLRRVNPKTGAVSEVPALVRSGPDGVILETAQGAEALDCNGLKENIVFDRLPDNLLDSPTLSVRADVTRAGRYTVMLRYLATGLNWSADYVANIAPDGMSLNLTGWLTLSNASETSFAEAPVDVVAGVINLTGQDRAILPRLMGQSSQCWPTDIDWSSVIGQYETVSVSASRVRAEGFGAPAPAAMLSTAAAPPPPPAMRDLGDLKLYALAAPTTVSAQQTKQIQFLQSGRVPFRRSYRIEYGLYEQRPGEMERPSQLVFRLDNAKGGALGKPLPAGRVAMIEAIGGSQVLAGRPSIDDTPVGVPLELKGNNTLAVSARLRAVTAAVETGDALRDQEVTITNRKSVPVTFEWSVPAYPSIRVRSENTAHGTRDGRLVWSLQLQPHSQAKLRYTILWPQ
jgi:hypothetical protein